jgi:uncharacterized protein YkwD
MKKLFAGLLVLVSLTTVAQQDSTVAQLCAKRDSIMFRDQIWVQDSLRFYMLELVNEFRVKHYAQKLQFDSLLNKGALDHLKYLYDLNILSHYQDDATSPYFTGKTPSKRCKQPAGENAALDAVYSGDPFNQDLRVVAQVLFEILKKSPGHRANMLHRKYKTFGFAGSLENVKSISNFYFVTSIGVQTFGY